MESTDLNWITDLIWAIAEDVLRDVYARGKYRDVILPMIMLCRLDAVLEPTKQAVLSMKATLDTAKTEDQDAPLRKASKQTFYNTSPFTLRELLSRSSDPQFRADFEAYLDGYSPEVQDILTNFGFRSQLVRLSKGDTLGKLLEKLLSTDLNLSPVAVNSADGFIQLPGLDAPTIGAIFEALVQRFNAESDEDTDEHTTPPDVAKLMARLIFQPIAEHIESGTYQLYDGSSGTGELLAAAGQMFEGLATSQGKDVITHLHGQESDAVAYAISKANLLLKGQASQAANLVGGPDFSTLAQDAFPTLTFDFMLSNPPHGKSWKSDFDRMGGKSGFKDPRFIVQYDGDPAFSLVPRLTDGQLLFLANMTSKMRSESLLGSRIAEIHNASSLFVGEAGQGESNLRRWIIENDWLEAVIALPPNVFYNTSAATYIWLLTNRKSEHRTGKVQLIDATSWFTPLPDSRGKKTSELSETDIQRISDTLLAFEETEQAKIFPNDAFGYWKVSVERPLRMSFNLSADVRDQIRQSVVEAGEEDIAAVLDWMAGKYGSKLQMNASELRAELITESKVTGTPITPMRQKMLDNLLLQRNDKADPVVKKVHKIGKVEANPLIGLYEATFNGKPAIVEYEANPDLRDTEQVPLLEDGGIQGYFAREVLPYLPDAWIDQESMRIGFEVAFARYFYRPLTLRTRDTIRADIEALGQEIDGVIGQILGLSS